jgi:phosphoribosyl 1,2-cyclic phosphate phosphodiesterase
MLGSGTSTGVPVIGCNCKTCTSEDPRNRRGRSSILIEFEQQGFGVRRVVVDTSTDFREQVLRERVPRIDAVLYTHAHADHIFGLDDLRVFNFRQGESIPCYGSEDTLQRIARTFAYIFEEGQSGGGKPRISLEPIAGPFSLFGRLIEPLPVFHGALPVLGFRVGDFAYVTDCNRIPESTLARMQGLDTLILGALRYRPHSTHFTIDEAQSVAREIGARRTWFTHLACDVDATDLAVILDGTVELGWDGLTFAVADRGAATRELV